MGRVIQPTAKPEFVTGKANVVQAIAPAQLLAVAWVDGEGRKAVCLALQFGRDANDGGPGVYILADESAMREQLTIANGTIRKGVREWLAKQAEATPEEVPDGADIGTDDGDSDGLDIAALDLTKK
jgi:hypothetical protein